MRANLTFYLIALFFVASMTPIAAKAEPPFGIYFEGKTGSVTGGPDILDLIFTLPLFCEGSPDSPCAQDIITDRSFLGDSTGDKVFANQNDRVCEGHTEDANNSFVEDSCVQSNNGVYVLDRIPGGDTPEGSTYSISMTLHDPITCDNLTGRFADLACCNGAFSPSQEGCVQEFKLDYRCVAVCDLMKGGCSSAIFSSYIISRER